MHIRIDIRVTNKENVRELVPLVGATIVLASSFWIQENSLIPLWLRWTLVAIVALVWAVVLKRRWSRRNNKPSE